MNTNGLMRLGSGCTRDCYALGADVVAKVPNRQWARCNRNEANNFARFGHILPLAACELGEDGVLIMERVEPVDGDMIYNCYGWACEESYHGPALPPWLRTTDGWQVGINCFGKLVIFDYGQDSDAWHFMDVVEDHFSEAKL